MMFRNEHTRQPPGKGQTMRTLHLTGPEQAALVSALELYLEQSNEPDEDAERILTELESE